MRILYIGESWLGSCARSLKEALQRQPDVIIDEIDESAMPKISKRWLRGVNRLFRSIYQNELAQQILHRVEHFKPEFVLIYKGHMIAQHVIQEIQAKGSRVVNIYPDHSPHAYGIEHQRAVGAVNSVISTKYFHSELWMSVYGYNNPCFFVPQGYDPFLHLYSFPAKAEKFDITIVATWRPEYGRFFQRVGVLLDGHEITVGIGGNGWLEHRRDYPAHWVFSGEMQGQSYIHWLRRGKICIAPLSREVKINGLTQPGDEDTTRTYELAAAHCFFIHRRTKYVSTLYDESTEVPMYDTPEELVEKILYYLPRAEERSRMAKAAHSRAVPAYSLDDRAYQIISILNNLDSVKVEHGLHGDCHVC